MTYAQMVLDGLGSVPGWVWLALVCVLAEAGILTFALREHARAEAWRRVAGKAVAQARFWKAIGDSRATSIHTKRTIVAPHFHAPRGR